MKKKYFTIIFPIFLLVFTTCKKSKHEKPVYDFSNIGSSYVGNNAQFKSTAPSGYSFTWDFGDGKTSAEEQPLHIYDRPGAFLVTLILNGDTSTTIDKTIKIGADSVKMSLMTGVKLWEHSSTMSRQTATGMSYTNSYYSDTSFAVNNIDPISFQIGNDILTYRTSTATMIFFCHEIYQSGHYTGSYNFLSYNFNTHKMVYGLSEHVSASGTFSTTFRTK